MPSVLQSHLLVLKPLTAQLRQNEVKLPSIAPFGIETSCGWNNPRSSARPSIAPFGIETNLLDIGFRAEIAFNRTFWYWNQVNHRHLGRSRSILQSHLLVLKLLPSGFVYRGGFNLQSHLLVLKLACSGVVPASLRAFNRTFWYWNLLTDCCTARCTKTLQSHLLVLKLWACRWRFRRLSPSIAPFGIETLQSSMGSSLPRTPSIAPFGIETYFVNQYQHRILGLQSHLLVLKHIPRPRPALCRSPSIAPFGIETRRSPRWLQSQWKPSIAPFGIETWTIQHHFKIINPLQSHLLVLKPAIEQLGGRVLVALQSHLLVLKQ